MEEGEEGDSKRERDEERRGGEGRGRMRETDNKKSLKVNDPSRAAFIYVVKFD